MNVDRKMEDKYMVLVDTLYEIVLIERLVHEILVERLNQLE